MTKAVRKSLVVAAIPLAIGASFAITASDPQAALHDPLRAVPAVLSFPVFLGLGLVLLALRIPVVIVADVWANDGTLPLFDAFFLGVLLATLLAIGIARYLRRRPSLKPATKAYGSAFGIAGVFVILTVLLG